MATILDAHILPWVQEAMRTVPEGTNRAGPSTGRANENVSSTHASRPASDMSMETEESIREWGSPLAGEKSKDAGWGGLPMSCQEEAGDGESRRSSRKRTWRVR
jgi:hypothetical protein